MNGEMKMKRREFMSIGSAAVAGFAIPNPVKTLTSSPIMNARMLDLFSSEESLERYNAMNRDALFGMGMSYHPARKIWIHPSGYRAYLGVIACHDDARRFMGSRWSGIMRHEPASEALCFAMEAILPWVK